MIMNSRLILTPSAAWLHLGRNIVKITCDSPSSIKSNQLSQCNLNSHWDWTRMAPLKYPVRCSEVVNMAQNTSDSASSSPASFRMVVPEEDFDPDQALCHTLPAHPNDIFRCTRPVYQCAPTA